jgi:hypothetical protein
MSTAQDLLTQALPGQEVKTEAALRRCRGLRESPWKLWQANNETWAVYLLVGERLSINADSIRRVAALGFKPAMIAPGNVELRALAKHFHTLQASVICDIAGRGRVISFIEPPVVEGNGHKSPTRIDRDILAEVAASRRLPRYLRTALRALTADYQALPSNGGSLDDREQSLLRNYSTSILGRMGFDARVLDATEVIRRLEAAGWGGRREHFFHSFQNYFMGLYAVIELKDHFNLSPTATRLDWPVDPYHVWFLTALWHDVGYGIQRLQDMARDVLGEGFDDDTAETVLESYVQHPVIQDGLREISSLMCHLLVPARARTGWMVPGRHDRESRHERLLRGAMFDNIVNRSHGVASAVRLYFDCIPSIRRRQANNRRLLQQTLLLACCSMPFHDWRFRKLLRDACGSCLVPTVSLPFAALLAFVDSIQDDRRDLDSLRHEIGFLERLLVAEPATVTAKVNPGAMDRDSLLLKLIEARDVLASLSQTAGSLMFEYPTWMVG